MSGPDVLTLRPEPDIAVELADRIDDWLTCGIIAVGGDKVFVLGAECSDRDEATFAIADL